VKKLLVAVSMAFAVNSAVVGPARPAGLPYIFDPAMCTIPSYIDLVGCKNGVVDPYGTFTVTLRTAGGSPISGCKVEIVFNSDLKIYSACPGVVVDCAGHSVTAISGPDGVATFDIAGATINSNGVASGSAVVGASIYGCAVPLGQATVCVFDESGAVGTPGVSAIDLAGWVGDFGKWETIGYKGRSDFNHDGNISAIDLARWIRVFGQGNSAGSCGSLCP
jgi:hypothetical protein